MSASNGFRAARPGTATGFPHWPSFPVRTNGVPWSKVLKACPPAAQVPPEEHDTAVTSASLVVLGRTAEYAVAGTSADATAVAATPTAQTLFRIPRSAR